MGERIMKKSNMRSLQIQAVVSLGMTVTWALIIWKGLMCFTGTESPFVVVISESMEPGFKRGDILFIVGMSKEDDAIRAGQILVFKIDGLPIPIVHRVIEVHEHDEDVDLLTKGDNNPQNDRILYAHRQLWLQRHHIIGKAVGYLPYLGWVTIIMTEKPLIKVCPSSLNYTNFGMIPSLILPILSLLQYLLIGAFGLVFSTSKVR